MVMMMSEFDPLTHAGALSKQESCIDITQCCELKLMWLRWNKTLHKLEERS